MGWAVTLPFAGPSSPLPQAGTSPSRRPEGGETTAQRERGSGWKRRGRRREGFAVPLSALQAAGLLRIGFLGRLRSCSNLAFDHTMDQESTGAFDFLEPSVLLDETHYQEGFRNGYFDGLVSGKEEGREVGLKMGFQVGQELGFYQSCLDVWTSVTRVDQGMLSARVKKNIEQMAALVSSYPMTDPENEQIQDIMEKIRLKFRIITASLGVKLEYQGQPTSSKQDVEDL